MRVNVAREPPRVGTKGKAQRGTRRGTRATSAVSAQGLGGVFEDRRKDFYKGVKFPERKYGEKEMNTLDVPKH